MASRIEVASIAAGSHGCHHCGKSFPRLCDLNKHAKSHSRPFKCSFTSCKYHDHGWPTAKELERHVNDKHSEAPRVFPCYFDRCTYTSKRESNCKQHMEKAHAWKYIRSKSNGKRLAIPHTGHAYQLKSELSSPAESGTQVPRSLPTPNADFVLFPPESDTSVVLGEEDDDLYLGYEEARGPESQVYLPWTSPMTRLRKNESVIEMFTQTYNGAPEKTTRSSQGDSLVDPRLSQYSPLDVLGQRMFESRRVFAGDGSIKLEATSTITDRLSSVKRKSDASSVSGDSTSERLDRSAAAPSSSNTPFMPSLEYSNTGEQTSHTTQATRKFPSGRRRSYDEGSQPPTKKFKPTDEENFTDTNMPDIFRFAHPQIYDRDQKERYSPCHSLHRDISTLVRHLSRPAHRLNVTVRAISSFEMPDEDFRHPRVALCRRCWRTFVERKAFDQHISGSCEKVSKGKREKWRILLDTFTPLVPETQPFGRPALSFENTDEDVEVETGRSSSHMDSPFTARGDLNFHNHFTPHLTPVSPAAPLRLETAGLSGPAVAKDFVPASEHLRLQKELHEKHQQLEQVTKALFALGSTGQGSPDVLLTMRTGRSPAPRSRAASGPKTQSDGSDQDSLVLHMDSQSTDVDVQGLMHEAQETLSRQNSGLSSTSRSTIHHVPTSPPPLPTEPGSDGRGDMGAQTSEPMLGRRPPESLPDSAYGTDPRRGSLGDMANTAAAMGRESDSHFSDNYHHKIALLDPRDSHKRGGESSADEGVTWTNPFDAHAGQTEHHTFDHEEGHSEPYDPSFHFLEHEHDYSSPNPLDLEQYNFSM
ncbi:hypothetical protein B0T24DRAFT_675811 [Lasiosphaeria ovina]|uniref:C2H2-type domain-containing protein n=1 Tax=Lasiosphaeria ovina TaxID=92902 RepID=A0AAE0TU10_9PEZI|nr:hypothetical protein B0T24DRAFT_675811 [Lasiosphaeria ovina]